MFECAPPVTGAIVGASVAGHAAVDLFNDTTEYHSEFKHSIRHRRARNESAPVAGDDAAGALGPRYDAATRRTAVSALGVQTLHTDSTERRNVMVCANDQNNKRVSAY